MDKFTDVLISLIPILVIIAAWFIIRRILKSISDKINNSEANREETLKVLEEIREELKELNKKNSSGQF